MPGELCSPQRKMTVTTRHLKLSSIASIWAITVKFKTYLTGAKFVVYTDHNPLVHLSSAQLGATEQRWVARLASYDFEIKKGL
ncbi:hypothetical protein HOLleu_20367 [Holothuria leucospilota]|uniref:Reverse transcriptase RNase H-like domain-containing protein n=1 Tax=Holothuria leucospilota TaxID=206669 RepID=A0A9Q1H8N8_HOLLE|nr:hypothetical protein HOLleu_20367 [Holothuria leucospilota]